MVLQVKSPAAAVELADNPAHVEAVETTTAAAPVAKAAEPKVVEGTVETAAEQAAASAVVEPAATVAEAAAEVVEEPAAKAEPETKADAEEPVVETAAAAAEPVVETVAEQEAQAAAAAPAADSSSRAVAEQPKGGAVVVAPADTQNYFQKLLNELEADGQVGLELGFGVFPMISLDKGEFKVGDEEIGKVAFNFVPLLSKPKFAYRLTMVPDKDQDAIFADSDRAHLDPDSPVSARIVEWKEKHPGSSFEVKTYQDVFAFISEFADKPELQGQICILSVAPTSVRRYTRECITVKGKGYAPHECVFNAFVGAKVRGDNDYYPWEFKALGSCKKLGVVVTIGTGVKDEEF